MLDDARVHDAIWRELARLNIKTTAGNVMSLTKAVLSEEAAQQSVQRIGFKRPLVARIGYFFIRKGWWLVGYANR